MEKNKISVITVVKNSSKTIEKTIQSLLNQKYENIEYLVIDGKSTDGTLEILDKYKKNISLLISEEDKGIWDAMNKGVSLAKGDIIGFLNADDTYYENSLNIVNDYFINNEIDFLFGSVEKYKLMHGYKPWKIKWSFGFYTSHSLGFFIKTNKHKEVGFYNSRFLSADLDFFYRMIVEFKLKGIGTKKNEIFGKFSKGGFSSRINYADHLRDLNLIRIHNKQNKLFVYLLYIGKIIKKPFKFLLAINKKTKAF
tara:strand:+ start:1084 stop:1842 length:759 start_codon:yes stop_codon:yes gene_type:complete